MLGPLLLEKTGIPNINFCEHELFGCTPIGFAKSLPMLKTCMLSFGSLLVSVKLLVMTRADAGWHRTEQTAFIGVACLHSERAPNRSQFQNDITCLPFLGCLDFLGRSKARSWLGYFSVFSAFLQGLVGSAGTEILGNL